MTQPSTTDKPVPRYYRGGRNLPVAITMGVLMFSSVVLTLAFWQWGFILLVTLAFSLAAVELHRAMARIGAHSELVPIIVGTVAAVCGSYLFAGHPSWGLPSNTVTIGVLALTSVACLVLRLRKGQENYVHDAAASLMTIGYVPLLGSTVSLMLAGDLGRERIITFLLCVVGSDTGGFIGGVAFGKHPMAPRISPKKTWEGFAGSIAAGVALGMGCAVWLLHVGAWVGVVLGVLLVALGTCGDLVESMVKRDVGIKDMSNFIPAHGGVMDRLDSLLVAAPLAWFLMYLMVPGG